MRFTLEIDCDTDAFQPDPTAEIYRIFTWLPNKILQGQAVGNILDSNGNTVGEFQLTES
jgi:hypothetical protein